jgi:hypothetical protein
VTVSLEANVASLAEAADCAGVDATGPAMPCLTERDVATCSVVATETVVDPPEASSAFMEDELGFWEGAHRGSGISVVARPGGSLDTAKVAI